MPKVYWRDSGILHPLAGIDGLKHLLGNPLSGHSWEGYCLGQIIPLLQKRTCFTYYRTQAGAEIDLILETSSAEVIAIEVKRTLSPKLSRVFLKAPRH
jgi:predicted AAA+ superfamily ATPase